MQNLRLLVVALLLCTTGFATSRPIRLSGAAHAFNQSYIYLRIDDAGVEGRLEINLSDLNRAIGTDFRTDLTVTEEEVTARIVEIEDYLYGRTSFAIGGKTIERERLGHAVYESNGSQYVSAKFDMIGVDSIPDEIEVTHDLVFEVDAQHRGFLVIEHFFKQGTFMNEGGISLTFDPGKKTQVLDLTDTSIWRGIGGIVKLGVEHIWIGIDHILFLLALLLPSVLRREERKWEPRESFGGALWQVAKIVTVFTVAHSITLSLAAMDVVRLSSRVVESVIAFSIAVAALDIIFPIFGKRILLVVLGFGLFHGFGFANVLGEMRITGADMALSLLGFNAGVELGQLAIVLALFPFLFVMRRWKLYRSFLIQLGAAVMIFVGLYWFTERAFEVDLPLGEYLAPVFELFNGSSPES